MEPTLKFKLANLLMKNYKAFDTVVADIRTNETPPLATEKIAGVLKKYGPDNLLQHPETLLDGMYRHLGDNDAWTILLGIFRMHKPDFPALANIKIYMQGLEKLARYFRAHGPAELGMERVILDALSDLSEAELKRVKLLLSWTIVQAYGKVNRACICTSSPDHLTEQIFAKYSEHAAYVMSLVFTQIERPDLLDKLAEAASVRREAEAIPDEALRGNAPA